MVLDLLFVFTVAVCAAHRPAKVSATAVVKDSADKRETGIMGNL
jgi:hypothetical protein